MLGRLGAAHVDVAEIEVSGVLGQPVHDRNGCDAVWEGFDPGGLSGLRGDERGQPAFPVARTAKRSLAAAGSVPTVRKSSMINRFESSLRSFWCPMPQPRVMSAPRDHPSGVSGGVPVLAGCDPDRAGQVGHASAGEYLQRRVLEESSCLAGCWDDAGRSTVAVRAFCGALEWVVAAY